MKKTCFRRQALLALALIASIALVIAACGGGEEATPTPTRAPAPTATPTPAPTPAPTATPVAPRLGGVIKTTILRSFEPWDTYDRIGKFGVGWLQNMLSNFMTLNPEDVNKIEPDLVERSAPGSLSVLLLPERAVQGGLDPVRCGDPSVARLSRKPHAGCSPGPTTLEPGPGQSGPNQAPPGHPDAVPGPG